MGKIYNPCNDICIYTGPKGWCIGCGRTRAESRQWERLQPYARQRILQQLKRRLAKIDN
ncbi:MAG: DUF1289 domain-containing protein [Acidiferrobacteraceae bacterium]|nr:DUF1289 domain-containing protein [Acidiferrobacteraceae bacterium]